MGKCMRPVDLSDITITDSLFQAYVENVYKIIIPHQWRILNDQLEDAEPTHCIENFRIAAGEKQGTREGVVFQDTDVYKWLEAVSYCLMNGKGIEYENLADNVIDLIGKAQEPDGYLNTYFTVNAPEKKWTNLVEGHELYTSGHMIEAAVAYYRATGKNKLLQIAMKNADLICQIFGTGEKQIPGYPGHQEIELALVKLYRITGDEKYLRQADYFIRQRGKKPSFFLEEIKKHGEWEFFPEFKNYDLEYSQAAEEPIKQSAAKGHAVRAMYMCAAMADLAQEENDSNMLEACKRIWDSAVNRRMYITGGIGSSGYRERFTTDYDLPNNTNYSETCASIGLMMFGQRMTAVTGDASYYDVVERALYNTVLAGINMEGNRYFYVNPLEVVPEFCTEHTYMEHVKPIRQKWFSVACCPPNVARTLASLGQYIYASDDESVFVHQYISSKAKIKLASGLVEIDMQSNLLQTGNVTIQIEAEESGKIRLRIPKYAGNWCVMVQKKKMQPVLKNGYCIVEIVKGHTTIELQLDVKAKWMAANNQVRADVGKAALVKGPMVYCLEQIDNGSLLAEVYVKPNIEICEEEPDKSFYGEIPVLGYEGVRIHNKDSTENSLYNEVQIERQQVRLRAIPYCFWNNRGEGEMLVWQKLIV